MKKITIAIMAHVDAGKTTLSEAILYKSGSIRTLGRVDHRNTLLDTNALEKERGITIFSKQAEFTYLNSTFTLLDTPGHIDFSAETERTFQVADYAIVIINASDGIQGHTQTLWDLLKTYNVPAFIFVNKLDLSSANKEAVVSQIHKRLGDNCIDFGSRQENFYEKIALSDEDALSQFIEKGSLCKETITALISKRKIFPLYFGSALKMEGVDEFMKGLCDFTKASSYREEFGARVYKISYDLQGNRQTHLKVTGGSLQIKDTISHAGHEEKINQIRFYQGAKFTSAQIAKSGDICAVLGLEKTYPGERLGFEEVSLSAILEPVLSCKIIPPENIDVYALYEKLRPIADEEPTLNIMWDEILKEIHIRPMGEIQLEVLKQLVLERYDLEISFGKGNILYKETIGETVEAIGHFEPLRHYAEVHLLLEPGKKGSGIVIGCELNEDELSRNWQRLILTHLYEKDHIGVLTGSPITDMKITLVAAKAHLKHTQGGDFREATYRAVRQGLRSAKSMLLEPYYSFRLEVPNQYTGRAITDMQNLHGVLKAPLTEENATIITGEAPVATIRHYQRIVSSYTGGQGKISLSPCGYRQCHNSEEVISKIAYNADRDLANSADSVFCANGAGFVVKWNEVHKYMHLESVFKKSLVSAQPFEDSLKKQPPLSTLEQDKELYKIFENTYGPIKQKSFVPQKSIKASDETHFKNFSIKEPAHEYLLVDGYNMIFAWDDLKELAKDNLDAARSTLIHWLINYRGYKKCEVIVVFDAYKVHGGVGAVKKQSGVYIVYTKEAETADMYIEKTTFLIGKKHRVKVATSDNMEQMIIQSHGCTHISAMMLKEEIDSVNQEIRNVLDSQKQENIKRSFSNPNIK